MALLSNTPPPAPSPPPRPLADPNPNHIPPSPPPPLDEPSPPPEEEPLADHAGGDDPPAAPPPPRNPRTTSALQPQPPPQSLPQTAVAPSLLHLSFNQDYGCFAAGTEGGFRIYNCDPFREIFRRDFPGAGAGAGVASVEMLFRCNILALVGGGLRPYSPPHKVMIWDDHESRCIGELSFRSEVRTVRLRRDRIVVVLDHKIFMYNFGDLTLVHQIETVANPRGLCAVSQQPGSLVLVCPGVQKGQIRVEHYDTRRTKFITAHDSRVACFSLSQDGRLIATASSKGTLVRIFSTADGSLLQEVRRGADRAEIQSMAFSANMQWLAVSSDKGTIHVFSIKINLGSTTSDRPLPAPDPDVPHLNPSLSFIKGVLPKYFHSEWSVAQYRLHEGTEYIVGFGHQKNTVVIIGMDGSFYRCQFDPATGGEMIQLECYNFLRREETP